MKPSRKKQSYHRLQVLYNQEDALMPAKPLDLWGQVVLRSRRPYGGLNEESWRLRLLTTVALVLENNTRRVMLRSNFITGFQLRPERSPSTAVFCVGLKMSSQ